MLSYLCLLRPVQSPVQVTRQKHLTPPQQLPISQCISDSVTRPYRGLSNMQCARLIPVVLSPTTPPQTSICQVRRHLLHVFITVRALRGLLRAVQPTRQAPPYCTPRQKVPFRHLRNKFCCIRTTPDTRPPEITIAVPEFAATATTGDWALRGTRCAYPITATARPRSVTALSDPAVSSRDITRTSTEHN